MKQFLLSVLLTLLPLLGYAQEQSDSIVISAELMRTVSSGSHTPFWLAANKQGLSSIDKGYGYFDLGTVKRLDKTKRFSWGAGVELVVPWLFTSDFVIQQLYAEVKYRSVSLLIGSRNHESDFIDQELSSGELLYSGNARPIPQVRIGVMDFQQLHFTNNWIGIKGYLSYGKFTDSAWQQHWASPGSRYAKGAWVCTRGVWVRGGDESRFPLVAKAGVEMATQFEGTIYNLDLYETGKQFIDLKMPGGFSAWMKAIVPLAGGSIATEYNNAQGNTIGTYNLSLEWIPDSDWRVKAYWQHMFEDHSMMFFQFPWKDGLWGVNATLPANRFLSSLTYEYLYSKYQSGPVYNDTCDEVPEQVSGVDSYYNHSLYPGWMHWGMGIGNPFSVSPIYNSNHILEFYATRNISHHLGLKGNPAEGLEWRVLVSNTRSWGTYWRPFPEVKSMWNFLADVKWRPLKLKQLECNLSIAFDRGNLVGNNFGVLLGIRCDLPVKFKKN